MAAASSSTSAVLRAVSSSSVNLTPRIAANSTVEKLISFKLSNPLLSQNLRLTTTRRSFTCKSQSNPSDSSRPSKVQELNVYEINKRDGGSPAYLRLSQKQVNCLGDLVPFSNKVEENYFME